MPTYQYACKECDHRFEAVQSFSDPSLTTCPQCSGALRKVFSAVGVVFKGSGFYRTDSRDSSKSKSSSTTSTTKTESKSASKSETNSSSSSSTTTSTAAAAS